MTLVRVRLVLPAEVPLLRIRQLPLVRTCASAHRKMAPLATARNVTPHSPRIVGPIPSQSLIPGLL